MPDHVHFFCSPAAWPTPDFHKWMTYWKALATRAFWQGGDPGRDALPRVQVAQKRDPPKPLALQERNPPEPGDIFGRECRHPPLFQRDCWDTQLRKGERYSEKWEYVRYNPVRKGLAGTPDDWPWQGELNVLSWHD